eukprot:SAG11_NODE_1906_length_4084_cov_31.351568_3_plen_229_part_00
MGSWQPQMFSRPERRSPPPPAFQGWEPPPSLPATPADSPARSGGNDEDASSVRSLNNGSPVWDGVGPLRAEIDSQRAAAAPRRSHPLPPAATAPPEIEEAVAAALAAAEAEHARELTEREAAYQASLGGVIQRWGSSVRRQQRAAERHDSGRADAGLEDGWLATVGSAEADGLLAKQAADARGAAAESSAHHGEQAHHDERRVQHERLRNVCRLNEHLRCPDPPPHKT